jgi:glycosyltransferase involved in cell wall biosynthesis
LRGAKRRSNRLKEQAGDCFAAKSAARNDWLSSYVGSWDLKISVIVPVRNGGPAFAHCLSALRRARAECAALAETELIVVDDGSTDDSLSLAQAAGAHTISTADAVSAPSASTALQRFGPALARNLGARAASGDCLFFVDADVALHPDALRRAALAFQSDPELDACFGSYDDAPAAPNFLSQYKNLFHHYVHQHARAEASTFWTGCGAIRASVFHALGGFDERAYRRPSIEDIDLGYRLRRRGGKILLLKDMQCVHLKRWTARSLLRSDIFERGVPWTMLLWRESRVRREGEANLSNPVLTRRPDQLDLNLQTSNRVSVAFANLFALSLFALPLAPQLWPAPLALAATLLFTNRHLYSFFFRKRGLWFALAVVPWHWLYYLYNGLSFTLGTLHYFLRRARPVAHDGAFASSAHDT